MVDQEITEWMAADAEDMRRGDAPHLAVQHLPKGVRVAADVAYCDDGSAEHLLDVYRPVSAGNAKLPVVIDFHGGGLYYGVKENNQCRDMYLAAEGFAVVNANYRLVPHVGFLDQVADAMAAFSWIAAHGDAYGFDLGRFFVTGDSAGACLALYAAAANCSDHVAKALRVEPLRLPVAALALVSGMLWLRGGVRESHLAYQRQAFFPSIADRVAIEPYLDLDSLVVDAPALPPVYLATSAEDFLCDNSLEFARILQRRHRDYALEVWPKGRTHPLPHVFGITQIGGAENNEAREAVHRMAAFFKACPGESGK